MFLFEQDTLSILLQLSQLGNSVRCMLVLVFMHDCELSIQIALENEHVFIMQDVVIYILFFLRINLLCIIITLFFNYLQTLIHNYGEAPSPCKHVTLFQVSYLRPVLLHERTMGDLNNVEFGVTTFHAALHPGDMCGPTGLPMTPNSIKVIGKFQFLTTLRHPHLCQYLDIETCEHGS